MIHIVRNTNWETPNVLTNIIRAKMEDVLIDHSKNMVIRWGVANGPNDDEFGDAVVLNPKANLQQVSNKFTELSMLHGAQDDFLHSPKVTNDIQSITEWPCVGRPSRHSQGKSFWILKSLRGYNRMMRMVRRRNTKKKLAEYFTEFIPTEQEYRIHVCYDGVRGRRFRVLRISKKIRGESQGEAIGRKAVVRSHRNGWVFETVSADSPELTSIRKCARRAVKCLGLHFGAVDIGVTSDGTPYVFEVNTAPGLDAGGLERYSDFLINQYIHLDQWRPPINE